MSTRSGPRELAEAVGTRSREFAGMVRRMIVTRTRTARWQVTGHKLLDGNTETRDAELFGGVGFHARPNEDDDTEAIVAFPAGGQGGPIIVAVRQEARRRVVTTDLAAAETQIHNSATGSAATIIRIKADGTVEIRSLAGVALPLPTLAEFNALVAAFNAFLVIYNAHTHVLTGYGTTVGPVAPGVNGAPGTGTTILRTH